MADEVLVLKGQGSVDVQIGGPGNNWKYLSACAAMTGPTVPYGGTEIRWCQDPNKADGFRISSKFKTAPDQIGFDLTTKLGKVEYLNGLECPFTTRARYAKCDEREDPSNYDPFMLAYCDSDLQEKSYDDLVITDPGNNDEIMVTTPVQASYEYRVKLLNASRTGTLAGLGDQPINDIEYCDQAQCPGVCSGVRSDGCAVIWGVTDVDVVAYPAPSLIRGIKDLNTSGMTWTNYPILGLNNNVEGIECAGSRLIVSSNGDSSIAYNDLAPDQDEWNVVVIGNAPAASPHALFARTSREVWLACANGYVYKSVDGGATWDSMHEGTETTETLNAVWAYDKDLIYAAGDNGVMIRSQDGGMTWTDITEVTTTAANILKIIVPPNRPDEVYIGTNNGMIYRSTDAGATFAEMTFVGQGVGTVDDLDFCGPCAGDVLYILHNDAGPRARILRDLSGGAGGADVEIVMDWLDVISTGIELNALACCNVNEAVAAGENYGGYPTIIKVS
jgi:hypothetical protein